MLFELKLNECKEFLLTTLLHEYVGLMRRILSNYKLDWWK